MSERFKYKMARHDQVVGTGVHRSGWPRAFMELAKRCNQDAHATLDDFCDYADFSYAEYRQPWVGVMHHPARVRSPLSHDRRSEAKRITNKPRWHEASLFLRGVVCMSRDLARWVERSLKVPTLVVKHPTGDDFREAWSVDKLRWAFQPGYFLRDVHFVRKLRYPGWLQPVKAAPYLQWHKQRDEQLARADKAQLNGRATPGVTLLQGRLDDDRYDEMLASSVVLNWLHGASANNVVVECVARGTPMLVNRLPAVEEYLGADYPLFCESVEEGSKLLTDMKRLVAAHEAMIGRQKTLPTFEEFAAKVVAFAEETTRC